MSEIRTDTISAANGTDPVTLTKQSAAKAFGVFSVSAGLRGSLNISSALDVGTGKVDLNFASSMSQTSFAYSGSGIGSANTNVVTYEGTSTTNTSKVAYNLTVMSSGSSTIELTDGNANTLVHGDLA